MGIRVKVGSTVFVLVLLLWVPFAFAKDGVRVALFPFVPRDGEKAYLGYLLRDLVKRELERYVEVHDVVLGDNLVRESQLSWDTILVPLTAQTLAVLAFWRKKHRELSERERHFFREKLREAREVLSCLSYRYRTLLRVLEYIVEQEREFFHRGPSFFVPLTQGEIAGALGISVSGVCQVLKGKFLRFPDGVVRSVKFFFDASYPVKEAMRTILLQEDPRHPFSDREIAEKLRAQGICVARRTCTLYREEMGIPPSHLRRRILKVQEKGV